MVGLLDLLDRAIHRLCSCGGSVELPEPHVVPGHEPPEQAAPPEEHKPQHIPQPPIKPEAPPVSQPPHRPEEPHRPAKPHRVDQNQVNQHDERYMALRAKANEEGDQMAKCFKESHEAYTRGDGALAKELSGKGHAHEREMHRLNDEASEWIFIENNKDSQPGEVDLHGLYVKEAIKYSDQAIQEARQRGDSEIHFIVGKGLHSPNHMAKLGPAIEELMQKHSLVAELDPTNSGVLIVSLDGQPKQRGPQLGSDDITRRVAKKDEECVIM